MPDSFSNSGSRLAQIAAEKTRDSKVLDVLAGLSTGRAAYSPVPPLPRPNGSQSPTVSQGKSVAGSYDKRIGPYDKRHGESSIQDYPRQNHNLTQQWVEGAGGGERGFSEFNSASASVVPTDFRSSINLDLQSADDFYQTVGRWPTQLDNMIIEARRNWMINRGYNPSKQELMYAVNQGMLGYRDSQLGGNKL